MSLLELSSVWGGPCNLTWVLTLLGERVVLPAEEEDGLTIDSSESTTVTRVDLEAGKAAELEPCKRGGGRGGRKEGGRRGEKES